MPLDSRDIASSLKKKGFREAPGGDHDRYWLHIGEIKQSISTKLSRGSNYRTVDDSLVSKIARQLKLKRNQFGQLVECSMDGAQYVATLRANNVQLSSPTKDPKTQK